MSLDASVPWVAPPPEQDGIIQTVGSYLSSAEALATSQADRSMAIIAQLGQFAIDVPAATVPNIPVQTVTALPIGDQPVEPSDMQPSYPSAPAEPSIGALSVQVTTDDAPVFDVSTPLLADIPVPDPLSVVFPDAPTLEAVQMPTEPTYVLPDVPTLQGLNLPSVPVLDIPLFTDVAPTAPDAPGGTFAWSEIAYSSTLLTQMNLRLVDFVQGQSTGLTPQVEAAIWQRSRDRQAALTQQAVDEARRVAASRGFMLPTGTLTRLVQQAIADGLAKDADVSRDVMIKQADLEQQNFHFAFQSAIALESALIGQYNNVQQRGFEAAEYAFKAAIDIFNARVSLFQADMQAFGIKAQVFETRLKAALAQLDIYRAELDGQKLIGEMNQQQVAVYVAQLEGVKSIVDIYKSRVEAVKTRIDADMSQVEIYRARIQAVATQVQAKESEYEAYATRLKGEALKVQMFEGQVNAFGTRAQAYDSLVKARLGVAELDFKQTVEFPMDLYKARLEAFQTGVVAESDRLKSLATVFAAKVQAFGEGERAKATFTEAQVEAVKATTAVYTSQAQLALQAADINLRTALSAAETVQTSIRAAGQLSGQMTAAALSARSVSASMSASANQSNNNSAANTATNEGRKSLSEDVVISVKGDGAIVGF